MNDKFNYDHLKVAKKILRTFCVNAAEIRRSTMVQLPKFKVSVELL